MATYNELQALRADGQANLLKGKISSAILIKAKAITALPSPTAEQRAFALKSLENPEAYLGIVFNYILGEYNAVSVATITGAPDATVQTAVNAAVDTLLAV